MAEETRNLSLDFLLHKSILLDTCFMIKLRECPEHFTDFIDTFNNLSCGIAIHSFIASEFLRGSATKSLLNSKLAFLEDIQPFDLTINKEIIESSTDFANLYSNKRLLGNQISIVDCINAAILKKYGHILHLVTLDNSDYPLFIFDRIKIITIDTSKEIINCGFYQFNREKFQSAMNDFNKTI